MSTYRQAEQVQADVEAAAGVRRLVGLGCGAGAAAGGLVRGPGACCVDAGRPVAGARVGAGGGLDGGGHHGAGGDPVGRARLGGVARALRRSAARGLDPGADGALDLSAFSEVAPLLNGLGVSLELAQERLAAVPTDGVREPVASAVTEFAEVAAEYAGTVDERCRHRRAGAGAAGLRGCARLAGAAAEPVGGPRHGRVPRGVRHPPGRRRGDLGGVQRHECEPARRRRSRLPGRPRTRSSSGAPSWTTGTPTT